MLRYFYAMPDRKIWLDLATRLSQESVARPCLWIGDPRLEPKAKTSFPNCDIVDFDGLRYAPHLKLAPSSVDTLSFFESADLHRIKDNALKMMDRIDPDKKWSRIDREAAFHAAVLWGIEKINRLQPDFFLTIESPHAYTSYILFELCKYYGVPTFSFGWFPLSGGLYLRQGLDEALIPYTGPRDESVDARMWTFLMQYADTVTAQSTGAWEPSYMKQQKSRDASIDSRFLSYAKKHTRGKLRRLLKPSKFFSVTEGYRKEQERHTFLSGLRSTLSDLATNGLDLEKSFVYFALQYEPERTTNPDGLEYTDQMRALAALRDRLPQSHVIYVREHPSQLYSSNRGHLGRSQTTYHAIRSIRGVELVDNEEVSSASLIRKAAMTATITGTAALEAALIGKTALIFGHSWFSGCPNIADFSDVASFEGLFEQETADADAVISYLKRRFTDYSFPGYQNPSQTRLYPDLADDETYQRAELEGALHSISVDLIGNFAQHKHPPRDT
ncbi:hypothetical protein [Roseibium album]|uniref:hypothetical protein n=1 Tax=Roseibium album TaxID=311410 RepID=UPI002493C055|nr:hypothetical protein [Roseibium album]